MQHVTALDEDDETAEDEGGSDAIEVEEEEERDVGYGYDCMDLDDGGNMVAARNSHVFGHETAFSRTRP